MNRKFSHRIRNALRTVTVCGCNRNKDSIGFKTSKSKRPVRRTSTKDNFDVIISADEKLRSLGHKAHQIPKSNTYCGPQNPTSTPSNSTNRTAAPDVAPPPIPSISNQDPPPQSNDKTETNDPSPSDDPPPLYPKPQIVNPMAERRIQRNQREDHRKSGDRDDLSSAKRRSRSAGPINRRRVRNSMHEVSSSKSQHAKHASNGRHSMYVEPLSDDEVLISGSESGDSDDRMQQWTKNPLMVRKSRKGERSNKAEKRKSFQNTENGFEHSSRERLSQQGSHTGSRELFIYPRRSDSSPNNSQKAKFQRMEENRKKRIDMAVTSDEECSPQLRISRLRQRAMMSSKIFNDDMNPQILNPGRGDNLYYQDNGYDMNGQQRLSQYDEVRNSKYDENYNIGHVNENYHPQYTKQEVNKRQPKLPNVLPEYLPENKQQVQSSDVFYRNKSESKTPGRNITVLRQQQQQQQQQGAKNVGNISQVQSSRVKLSSESPKLRSFNEVKTSQPKPLKQAVEKIELIQQSPNNSSDDSLDELIESNIQYLESEIESGKLKRQSGNFSNVAPVKTTQGVYISAAPGAYISAAPVQTVRQVVREPLKASVTKHGQEYSGRFQIPVDYTQVKTSNVNTAAYTTKSNIMPKTTNIQISDPRQMYAYGSATYSPNMQRRTFETNFDDMSKSDSHIDTVDTRFITPQNYFAQERGYVPYPVLNKQTGNIIYIQPGNHDQPGQGNLSSSLPSAIDAGMFSDVDYDIEVSERIKKWEKKLLPGQVDEARNVLNTIQEYESMSDSNTTDKMAGETPLEIRRELRQLVSPTDNTGIGKLSVNLTKSSSSLSDAKTSRAYYEPKVVSSETNLHRIFRVVQEPAYSKPVERETITVTKRRKQSADYPSATSYVPITSQVTMSENEAGSQQQQSWPPMVDSDSGVRKSWRLSRYEDEINELKEIVSDNFRDLKKRFDSDVSETDTRRASSPVQVVQHRTRPTTNVPVTLNIQAVTPSSSNRSPIIVRKAYAQPVQVQPEFATHYTPKPAPQIVPSVESNKVLSDYRHLEPYCTQPSIQQKQPTPPVSPAATSITLKTEKKLPVIQTIPVETKPQPAAAIDPTPDIWSPNMESRKGLVSIERVKARTLQTIPFSEDPVWKEMEGLATFEKSELPDSKVNFDEIDALLKLATGSHEEKSFKTSNLNSDTALSPSYTMPIYGAQTQHMSVPMDRPRKLSDSVITISSTKTKKPAFNPPAIQPLKLKVVQDQSQPQTSSKASANALDEVLEDIRASLQKKPLSPKLLKNIDVSDSNSSTTVQSPLSKHTKSFAFPKEEKTLTPKVHAQIHSAPNKSAVTPGYDNAPANWQQTVQPGQTSQPAQGQSNPGQGQTTVPPSVVKQLAEVGYIDPEFTQFPYIINGNYHLDPTLLSEKLKSTGLVHDSSDEQAHRRARAVFTQNQSASQLTPSTIPVTLTSSQSQATAQPQQIQSLDQSVDELKSLAQEVEFKLSQIKSRIVSADEGKLDSILLALRKFAPITEQRFFNVKFTPNYESEQARKSKLEDALLELDKVYSSLDLDDKSLLDRASRVEETGHLTQSLRDRSPATTIQPSTATSVYTHTPAANDPKPYRKSQIEEVERQTQNEFEDITKSFTVLLDEVTRQCRSVAQGSTHYQPPASTQHYTNQPPVDVITQERSQLKYETPSQRAVQDSYNTAIKELESVATGSFGIPTTKPVQSSVYLNLDAGKPSNERANQNLKNADKVASKKSIDIQVQSKPIQTKLNVAPAQFISMATEFKPSVATSVRRETSSSDNQEDVQSKSVSCQGEVKNVERSRAGRFRKKANMEHRKSMPIIMKTVETQTVETQTEPSVVGGARKFSMPEFSSDSSPDTRGFPVIRKLSTGIAKFVDMFDSSEDERGRDEPRKTGKKSQMKHSRSLPDIAGLYNKLTEDGSDMSVDKACATKTPTKTVTPKSVKHRSEAKSRFRSLQNGESVKKLDMAAAAASSLMMSSVTSEDGFDSPTTKPPVYPVWKYPGQSETPSPKKSEKRQAFGFDKDPNRAQSDNVRPKELPPIEQMDMLEVRRRTRSVGSDHENKDRPKSFHELLATFEQSPQRLEKFRSSALRKCASEDSVYTDLILQKIYHSDSDLSQDADTHRPRTGSGSELILKLEMKVKK